MAKTKSIKAPSSFGSVTNTVTETTLGSVSLPAYSVKQDYKIRAFAVCETTATNSTDTFALKLKLGSTALSTVTAFDAADGDVCFIVFEGYLDVSAETLNGVAFDGRTGQALANPEPVADLAFDTDAAQTITVTGTWSVADPGNNAVLKAFTVELEPVDV